MKGLTIGKLAKQAGIGIETVRFYERQGLISLPPRTESNYRVYPEEEAERLRFIKRAKAPGFPLHEIKELLALSHDPGTTRAEIKKRTVAKQDRGCTPQDPRPDPHQVRLGAPGGRVRRPWLPGGLPHFGDADQRRG